MTNTTLHSEVARRISLFEVESALPEYQKNMTLGKYVIYPQQKPDATNEEESKRE